MKHWDKYRCSKLPWRVAEERLENGGTQYVLYDANDYFICVMEYVNREKANAYFIVDAVNRFHELQEILKKQLMDLLK